MGDPHQVSAPIPILGSEPLGLLVWGHMDSQVCGILPLVYHNHPRELGYLPCDPLPARVSFIMTLTRSLDGAANIGDKTQWNLLQMATF